MQCANVAPEMGEPKVSTCTFTGWKYDGTHQLQMSDSGFQGLGERMFDH
jgi:hypothetical protein